MIFTFYIPTRLQKYVWQIFFKNIFYASSYVKKSKFLITYVIIKKITVYAIIFLYYDIMLSIRDEVHVQPTLGNRQLGQDVYYPGI